MDEWRVGRARGGWGWGGGGVVGDLAHAPLLLLFFFLCGEEDLKGGGHVWGGGGADLPVGRQAGASFRLFFFVRVGGVLCFLSCLFFFAH